jgi:ribonuclease D
MAKILVHINDLPSNINFTGDIAIDTEAMGLRRERDRLCLVQLKDETGDVHLVHFPQDSYDYKKAKNLIELLVNPSFTKIFHYARFDIGIMRYYFGIDFIPNIFCTKIASRLTRTYTDHHGLRSLLIDIIGVEIKKEQQSSNWGANILTEPQKNYAAADVLYLHSAKTKLTIMLKNSDRLDIAQKYFSFLDTIVTTDMLGFEEDLFRHQ